MITTKALVEYLLDNEIEAALIRRDYMAIFESMIGHEPDYEEITLPQLRLAVELALNDPYMRDFVALKLRRSRDRS